MESSGSESDVTVDATPLNRDGNNLTTNGLHINNTNELTPGRRLPFIVLMVMKIVCVFHHGNVTGDRKCYRCKMYRSRYRNSGNEANPMTGDYIHVDPMVQWYQDQDRNPSSYEKLREVLDEKPEWDCSLCESFWWNYDGVVERYNDRNIGVAPFWNHPGSWLISFAIIFGTFVFLIWDFLFYMNGLWWDPTQVVHIFNYGNFILILFLYPFCNLCSKIVSVSSDGHQSGLSWTTAINARFILKRLQFIGFRQKGIPGKALFVLTFFLPPLIAYTRGFIYISLSGHLTRHSGLSVVCCGVIMWILANFHYLVYLMRISFQRHFTLIIQYIDSHPRDLDDCRQILGNAIQDFNCFRGFMSRYMFVCTPVLTWSITTQVVWLYLVRDALCPVHNDTRTLEIIVCVALLSWTNILFSLTVIVWSLGGLDITYVIDNFKERIVMTTGLVDHSKNWERLIMFCDDVTHDTRYGVNAITLFSVISFFMALHLDQSQSVDYFGRITCNESAVHPATMA